MKPKSLFTILFLLAVGLGVLGVGLGSLLFAQVGGPDGNRHYDLGSSRNNFGRIEVDSLHIKSGGSVVYDGTNTQTGAPVHAPIAYSASGALSISPGVHKITKSSAIAVMTLAAPATSDEGTIMVITSQTAKAHTVTLTEGFNNGGSGADVATFGGAIGDNLVIVAINGHWNVITLTNVTLG